MVTLAAGDRASPGRGRRWSVAGPLLLVLAAIGLYGRALEAPARGAERELLVEDRVMDGTFPMRRAFAEQQGPMGTRPVGRLWLRGLSVFWAANPAGYRVDGLLALLLVAIALASLLRRLIGGGPVPWLLAMLALAWPTSLTAGLWMAARADLLALALVLWSATAAVAARQARGTSARERGGDAGSFAFLATVLGLAAVVMAPVGMVAALVLAVAAVKPAGTGRQVIESGAASRPALAGGRDALLVGAGITAAAGLGMARTALDLLSPVAAGELPRALLDSLVARASALDPLGPALPVAVAWHGHAALAVLAVLVGVAILRSGVRRSAAIVLAAGAAVCLLWLGAASALEGSAGLATAAQPLLVLGIVLLGVIIGRQAPRAPVVLLLLAASLACGVRTAQLAELWRDPGELHRSALARHPEDEVVRVETARHLAEQGHLSAALAVLDDASPAAASVGGTLPLERARILAELAALWQAVGTAGEGDHAAGVRRGLELVADSLRTKVGRERIDGLLARARLQLQAQPPGLREALAALKAAEDEMAVGDARELDLQLLLGHVRSELAYDQQAINAYERCLEIDPLSFRACYQLGNLLTSLADVSERAGKVAEANRLRHRAVLLLRRAYSSRAIDPQGAYGRLLVIQLGGNLGKLGYGDQAEALLASGLVLWPDDPRLLFNHALTLLGSPSTLTWAETEMRKALEIAERLGLAEAAYYRASLAEHLVRRGNGLLKGGDIDEAERIATQALEVAPEFHPARLLRADVYFARGQFSEAIGAYDEAGAANSDPNAQRVVRIERGHAVLQRGLSKALLMSQLNVAARKHPEARSDACAQYHRVKQDAIRDLEAFLEVLPSDDKAEDTRSRLANIRVAECVEEQLARIEPRDVDPSVDEVLRRQYTMGRQHWEEGKSFFDVGEHEAALKAFNKAISCWGRDAAYHYWRGRARSMLPGEEDAAKSSFARAIALDPALYQAYFHLGSLQVATETEEASKNLDLYLRLAPADDPLREHAEAMVLDLRRPR